MRHFAVGLLASMVAVAILAAAAVPAAAITIENYRKWRAVTRPLKATGRSLIEIRLEGVYAGLLLASQDYARRGRAPLFCPPKDLVANGKLVRELVDSEIETPSDRAVKPYPPDTAIEVLLLAAARRRWPCKGR